MQVKSISLIFIILFVMSSQSMAGDFSDSINKVLTSNDRPFNGVVIIAKGDKIIYQKASSKLGSVTIKNQFAIGSIATPK